MHMEYKKISDLVPMDRVDEANEERKGNVDPNTRDREDYILFISNNPLLRAYEQRLNILQYQVSLCLSAFSFFFKA